METQGRKNLGGRPPGATSVLSRRAREQAAATGILPHEILLDMARGNPQKVRRVRELDDGSIVVEEEWVTVTVEEQRESAKAAAPYYAPKLATVETVQGMNDDDLNSLIAQLAAQAGIGAGAGGEGAQGQAGGRQEDVPGAGRPARRRLS